jgi:hypothetical protein
MHPSFVLLADFGDVIAMVVTFLVPIIFVLSQVLGKGNKAPAPPPRPRHVPKPQPARPREVDDEVEQFLRRVAQRRTGGGKADEVVVVHPEAPPPRRLAEEVVVAEAVEAPSFPVAGRHLKPSIPNERLSRLDQTDEQVEEHLHDVFDHQLGRLSSEATRVDVTVGDAYEQAPVEEYQVMPDAYEPERAAVRTAADEIAETPTAAVGLAAMLSDTENLKQAIVLSEILNRPEHRW